MRAEQAGPSCWGVGPRPAPLPRGTGGLGMRVLPGVAPQGLLPGAGGALGSIPAALPSRVPG